MPHFTVELVSFCGDDELSRKRFQTSVDLSLEEMPELVKKQFNRYSNKDDCSECDGVEEHKAELSATNEWTWCTMTWDVVTEEDVDVVFEETFFKET